jgi:hypothetical protein
MEQPNAFFAFALVGFCVVAVVASLRLGARRGMLAALLGGTLLLPVFDATAGVPLLRTKAMFVAGVVLATSLALDARRWSRLRPSLLDLPMLVLCAVAYLSGTENDLGAYEALAAVFASLLVFGGPYLLGRLYLGGPEGLADLADAVVLAGLAYVPLCLWEVRMSPQLHRQLYGYGATKVFAQNVRFGGYRPLVFMNHGLMVALFMASATLVAWWLWRTRARSSLVGLPLWAITAALGVTTLLCKSTGAVGLLLIGIAALEGTRWLKTPLLILALAAVPPAFCAARLAGWSAEGLVAASARAVDADRAQSVQFRIQNEDALAARALERPLLGWGRWGRSRIRDQAGKELAITDSLWIITLGENGLVGLVALGLMLGLPALLLLRAAPARRWAEPGVAAAAALAMVGIIGELDDLLNTMATPVAFAIAGALVSVWWARRAALAHPAAPAVGPRRAALVVQGAPAGSPGTAWRPEGLAAWAVGGRQVGGWRDVT